MNFIKEILAKLEEAKDQRVKAQRTADTEGQTQAEYLSLLSWVSYYDGMIEGYLRALNIYRQFATTKTEGQLNDNMGK